MKIDSSHAAIFLQQNIEQHIDRIAAPGLDQLAHALADKGLVLLTRHRDQQHAVPASAGSQVVVVPAGQPVEDVSLHAGPHFPVPQAFEHLFVAAVVRPGRDDRPQIILPRRIGINVRANIVSFAASLGDQRDHLRHAAPQVLVGNLQMNDVDPNPGFLADRNGLGHRIEYALPFPANVA